MAKKLVELLKQLATKAGNSDDAALATILANAEIAAVEIPDELYTSFDTKLLSLTSALDNHPDIKNKYTALALSPMDAKINAFIDSLSDLDDDGRNTLKGEKSTYKRFDNLLVKIKELETKKAGANTDKDKTVLQTKIDKLHAELLVAKSDIEKAKTEYEQKLTTDKIDYRLRGMLTSLKTKFDDLPAEVRNDTLLGIINKHLQGQGLELKFDEKGDLQPYNKDGSKHYGANHTVTTMPALIDSLMAQNKLLVVNNSQQNQQQQNNSQQQQQQAAITIPGQDTTKVDGTNQSVAKMNLDAMESIRLMEAAEA